MADMKVSATLKNRRHMKNQRCPKNETSGVSRKECGSVND
jgi:hypothetical protein